MIEHGQQVKYAYKCETRIGYFKFMGNNSRGEAKFAFVGTKTDDVITTIHVESGNDFWKMLNGNKNDKTILVK